ncbi:MAG: hypothetical protein ACR2OO_08565 [Thermomicrobiales bacterium]
MSGSDRRKPRPAALIRLEKGFVSSPALAADFVVLDAALDRIGVCVAITPSFGIDSGSKSLTQNECTFNAYV